MAACTTIGTAEQPQRDNAAAHAAGEHPRQEAERHGDQHADRHRRDRADPRRQGAREPSDHASRQGHGGPPSFDD